MSDEDILKRAMGHFQTRTALHRMGVPVRNDHPVSDAEYQAAMTRGDRVEDLMQAAFDRPRDPRSDEYKQGCRAWFNFKCGGDKPACPYTAGTASSDAWYAGLDEGRATNF